MSTYCDLCVCTSVCWDKERWRRFILMWTVVYIISNISLSLTHTSCCWLPISASVCMCLGMYECLRVIFSSGLRYWCVSCQETHWLSYMTNSVTWLFIYLFIFFKRTKMFIHTKHINVNVVTFYYMAVWAKCSNTCL